ncbi:MAG TPA: metallophosphoesterase [Ignavibacteriales bacterium]|nr:metallophosphoesterase [Ignavibacteriales bacterium]
MKLSYILLLILLNLYTFAQKINFIHLSDIHIGAPKADSLLKISVNKINSMKNIDFVVITGDITDTGNEHELKTAKNILSKLLVPYYTIPGNHDTRYNYDGNYLFSKYFKTKFFFQKKGYNFIGINTAVNSKGINGHLFSEDITWTRKQLSTSKSTKNIFFFHQPLDQIDNFEYIFDNINFLTFFVGHGHNNSVLNYKNLKYFMAPANKYLNGGFNLVNITNDSVSIYSYLHTNNSSSLFYKGLLYSSNIEPLKKSFISYDSLFDNYRYINFNKTLYANPIGYNNNIYIAFYDGTIKCLSTNGSIIWSNKIIGSIQRSPIVIDSILIVQTVEGDIHTLNPFTGKIIQSIGTGFTLSSPLFELNYQGNKVIFLKKYKDYTPTVGVFTDNGYLLLYEVNTLQPLSQIKLSDGKVENEPILDKNKIYFTSSDGKIYCADPSNGVIYWSYNYSNHLYYNPSYSLLTMIKNNLYFSTSDNNLTCLDKILGQLKWKKEINNSWYTTFSFNDTLFLKSKYNFIYKISPLNGNILAQYNLSYENDFTALSSTIFNNSFIMPFSNGNVFQYRNNSFKKIISIPEIYPNKILNINNRTLVLSNLDGDVFIINLQN